MQLDLCSSEFTKTDEITFPQGVVLSFPPISLSLATRYLEALDKQMKSKDKNPKAYIKASNTLNECVMEYLNTNIENIKIDEKYLTDTLKLNILQRKRLPLILVELITGIEKK
jgi:hypothetical protein